ncbi:MAG: ComF family protein [Victivallales bacterium]|nr:ComF family protein [Victivallales bacterium]
MADRLVAPPLCLVCGNAMAEAPDGTAGLCRSCENALPCIPEGRRCQLCGGENDTALSVCHECATTPRPWLCGVTAFPYHGQAGALIREYKYHRVTPYAPYFARKIAQAWQDSQPLLHPECVVPIPLHWLRRLSRGFNQAELVARHLAALLGVSSITPLRRRRATGHQARLDADSRIRNLRRAFVVPPHEVSRIAGRSILLLDDVFTTGATLTAATEILLAAGAAEVAVATIARA